MADTSAITLSEKTKIPIGAAVSIIGLILAGAIWTQSTLFSLRSDITALGVKMATIESAIIAASADRWTGTDMRQWVEVLKARNPALQIPDARHGAGG